MTIKAFLVPEHLRPPWVIEEFPAAWYEIICDEWQDFVALVDGLNRICKGHCDIHQAKAFQGWPRVYYVGIEDKKDAWAFRLTWENQKETSLPW